MMEPKIISGHSFHFKCCVVGYVVGFEFYLGSRTKNIRFPKINGVLMPQQTIPHVCKIADDPSPRINGYGRAPGSGQNLVCR